MTDAKTPAKKIENMSFEDAMNELESLVKQLEGAQVPLDQSIALYERGAALKKHCETRLKSAEEKVAQITLDADGQAKDAQPQTF